MPPVQMYQDDCKIESEAEIVARVKAVRARLLGMPSRAIGAAPAPAPAPPPRPPRPKVAAIIMAVAEYFHIERSVLISDRRIHPLPYARQIIMYLATHLTDWSLPRIGRAIDRDHTTVIHGRDRIADLLAQNEQHTVQVVTVLKTYLETGERKFPPAPALPAFSGRYLRRMWSPQDNDKLKRLWTGGMATKDIGTAFHRSHGAIQKQLWRLRNSGELDP